MSDPILGEVRIVTLRVKNWTDVVAYYSEVLGLRKKFADIPNEYAMFEAGPIRIAIEGPAKPAYPRSRDAEGTMLNFETPDLVSCVSGLRTNGAKSISDVRQGPGYDYVAVRDPEGNEHIVFQRRAAVG